MQNDENQRHKKSCRVVGLAVRVRIINTISHSSEPNVVKLGKY